MRLDSAPTGETPLDIDAYLARIGYTGSREPKLETLAAMQSAHFLSVPFENLDIHLGRECSLDPERIFQKVVRERRGGWCHELNGLWVRVLRELGYRADLLAARVMRPDGSLSVPFGHATVLVHLDGELWLSDVDASSRFAGPLRLHETGAQTYGTRTYRVSNDANHWFVAYQEPHVSNGLIIFTLEPRQFDQFAEACAWQQTSAESQFVQRAGVARATERGRVDILGAVFSEVADGQRTERRLSSVEEFEQVLSERFDLDLRGRTWSDTVRGSFAAPAPA